MYFYLHGIGYNIFIKHADISHAADGCVLTLFIHLYNNQCSFSILLYVLMLKAVVSKDRYVSCEPPHKILILLYDGSDDCWYCSPIGPILNK